LEEAFVSKIAHTALGVCAAGLLLACTPTDGSGEPTPSPTPTPAPFVFYTPAWEDGGVVPDQYTCVNGGTGNQLNPEVVWANPPEGTVAFAMIFDDPTFGFPFPHWAFVTADADLTSIPEGTSNTPQLPAGVVELENGFGSTGYAPNCPCNPNFNTYRWRLWALARADLGITGSSTFSTLESRAKEHAIEVLEFSARSDACP
jgi:phosphatidylethanolamine-binding protein (PEBP) family uncharacterized protein